MFGRGAGIENMPDTLKSTSEGITRNRLILKLTAILFSLVNTIYLKLYTPTLREKPICVLKDGFNYSNHVDRGCSSHFCKAPVGKEKKSLNKEQLNILTCLLDISKYSDPSVLAHSRLGPRTMAMLLGVILLTSLSCASLARNLIRYL